MPSSRLGNGDAERGSARGSPHPEASSGQPLGRPSGPARFGFVSLNGEGAVLVDAP